MSTNLNTEIDAFQHFVAEQLHGRVLSLEESVAAFREYQEQLAKFKADIQPAIDQLDAGEGTPLKMQELLAEAKRRLASDGISD